MTRSGGIEDSPSTQGLPATGMPTSSQPERPPESAPLLGLPECRPEQSRGVTDEADPDQGTPENPEGPWTLLENTCMFLVVVTC